SGNKHLLALPGKGAHGDGSMAYDLDAAGMFRLVAPAGPGILTVQAATPRNGGARAYPQVRIRAEDRGRPSLRTSRGVGESFITSAGIIHPLAGLHSYRLVEPAVGAETLKVDMQLDPGRAVAGKVVGPDGKPFAGATAAGLDATYGHPAALAGDTFTARGLLA